MTSNIEAPAVSNIGTPLRNSRRERFCLALVGGVSQAEAARRAGYSAKVAASHANRLVSFVDVRVRLAELREILASEGIMTVMEMQQALSEIGRANLKDYHNEHGTLDPFRDDAPNPGAIAQVEQEYDPHGLEAFPVKVRLHDKIRAIDILCRIKKIYETGTVVNVQQAIVNVTVVSPKGRKLTDKVIEGERT